LTVVDHLEVVTAAPADRGRVVGAMVAAFVADPALRYFFPDDDSYAEGAAAFFGHLFDKRVHLGTVWTVGGGASVAMWDPPASGADHAGDGPALRLPDESLARLAIYDEAVHAVLPATPYWYLGVLGTHPDHAGRGGARAVTAAGLRHAAAAGLPAYLETANPRNVDVYRRLGWEVERTVAADALTVWVMRQMPG